MTFQEILKESGMSIRKFSDYFEIPYRTVQNWNIGTTRCPEYIVDLISYKLQAEQPGRIGKDDIKINGVGVVSKKEAMSILSREERKAVKEGTLTIHELSDMYKLDLVKKASEIGRFPETFQANFERVPKDLFDKLSPEEVALLVDGFYHSYIDGYDNRGMS